MTCYLHQWLLLTCVTLMLLSCGKSGDQNDMEQTAPVTKEDDNEQLNVPTPSKRDVFIPIDEYSLGQSIREVDLSNFLKYGDFYGSRLKIYHIDNVKALKENKYVTEVYLFFIDNTLSKIETILTKDQSNKFLIQYGNCSLKPKDHFNVAYLKEHGALQHINGRVQLNPQLTNFMLTWNKQDFNVYYRVREPNYKQLSEIDNELLNNKVWKYLYEPEYKYVIQIKDYKSKLFDLRTTYAFYSN